MAEVVDDSLIIPVLRPWYQPYISQLTGLQSQKRLPHAILLGLPGETDETGFLWQLSMSLLCQNRNDGQPCKQCRSCQLMLANTYPDFKLVSLQYDESKKKLNKNIKIDQIRELIHEVYLTRNYDNLKIAVIYPAGKMNLASANSLLKTLEEPADNALIILATHYPGKIPVTIRSRCQQWNLPLPSTDMALEWLKLEGLNNEAAAKHLDLAGGDPLLAIKLHSIDYIDLVASFKQQFAQYLKNQIDVVKLSQFLVANDISLVRRLISMVLKAYCQQFSGLQEVAVNKASACAMLDLVVQVERQLMTEENNLDIQLQLEDVLISIKQIINRSQQ